MNANRSACGYAGWHHHLGNTEVGTIVEADNNRIIIGSRIVVASTTVLIDLGAGAAS